ncbi:hypothetical protein C8R44DRAFT_871916 [Mycena epipterygia]|nr:hypothetical protein C8R44DRAFT_871916 [Mycena epipterygia]
MNNIPALPKIDGDVDIVLDIYVHHALKGGEPMSDEYGDTERLIELGGRVLDTTLAVHLFHERPMLTADEISDRVKTTVSDDKLKEWLAVYNIKSKFRAPAGFNILESPVEMRRFFHSYIGALYIRNGISCVHGWIFALLGSDNANNVSSVKTPLFPSGIPAPPPQHRPNPPSAMPSTFILNQMASQRGIQVPTYPAESSGPSHNPTWSIICRVGDVEKGRGSGKSQKLAKEEAARQALQALGWR